MRRLAPLVVLVLLAAAVPLAPRAEAAPARPQVPGRFAEGHVLVKADPDVLRDHGLRAGRRVGRTGWVVVATGSRPAAEVRDELAADGRVTGVELDYVRTADAVPDDSFYEPEQGELRTVELPTAWDTQKASSTMKVAVLDSGVDLDHPDLVDRLVPGWDYVDDDATPQDEEGHGTLVAGIVGADTDNGRGGAGASWGASIVPLRVLDEKGDGFDSDIATALTDAVDGGVTIANLSLSGPTTSDMLEAAVDYAEAHDVLVVAAAGNTGLPVPQYPAAYDSVLAVGATDDTGTRASFSQQGDWLDVVAPGVDVFGPLLEADEAYAEGDGTSFAAPIVAGVAAMLRTQRPTWTAAQVRDRLRQTATDKGAAGFDNAYGHGLLDAAEAVELPPPPPPPPTTTTTSSTTTTTPPPPPPPPPAPRSGYWMVDSRGYVYAFGDARHLGGLNGARDNVVDLEPTPSGNGYWLLTAAGEVFAYGDARHVGQPGGLPAGERVTSMSAHPGGAGYWVFTDRGRAFNYGGAPHRGDMGGVPLNGPVLDSVATPTGNGYYMVASDGGIFAFGDARFRGSMGGHRLNAPVQSLVPDGDNDGYWLVASDGGIFAFSASFRGSMGGSRLNRPVTGMVRFGDGYLMVGEDGGIFNFSSKPFHGSLGANPPAQPVVAVAALEG